MARRILAATVLLVVALLCCCAPALAQPAPTCIPMPANSVCSNFYPAGKMVDITGNPAINCVTDAENFLKAAPTVWASLKILSPTTTCSSDFAQMMCFAVYKPCQRYVSQEFCQHTLDTTAGTCGQQTQGFLAAAVPLFTTVFNCSYALYQPIPRGGDGPFVSQATVASLVPADQCVELSPTSICRGVVDYPIYLPWSYYGNQSLIENQVATTFTQAFITAATGNGCLESLEKMLCSLVYTRCDRTVLPTSLTPYLTPGSPLAQAVPFLQLPFPQLPCSSLCDRVQTQCAVLLSSNAQLAAYANCSAMGTVLTPTMNCAGAAIDAGGANFPNKTSTLATLTLNGYPIPLVSQCNQFISTYPTNVSDVFTCPFPLVRSSSGESVNAILGGSCALPCPSIVFSRDDWSRANRFVIGFIVASFVTSLFLWLTWVIFPVKRKQTNTLMFNSCTLWLSFTMLIMSIHSGGRPSTISCMNDSDYNTQSQGGMCLYVSMCFFFFSIAGVGFWFTASFDLYLKIVLNLKIDMIKQKKLNRAYMSLGWGMPGVLLIIALGTHSLGGTGGTPWCFFQNEAPDYADWVLFYLPIMAMIVGGCFCMLSIIYKMIMSARATGSTKRAGWWKTQIRPFLFILIFIFIFTFIVAYRANTSAHKADYTASATEYVTCIISTLGDTDYCGEKPKSTPNLGLWFLLLLAVSGQGLFNSIIFGSQWVNVQLWYGLLTGKGTDYRGDNANTQTDGSQLSKTQESTQHNHSTRGPNSRPLSRGNSGRIELGKEDQVIQAKPNVHISATREQDNIVSASAVPSDSNRI